MNTRPARVLIIALEYDENVIKWGLFIARKTDEAWPPRTMTPACSWDAHGPSSSCYETRELILEPKTELA